MAASAATSFPDPVADCAIEDYGAIGDCRTAALVSRFGSIDWWCAPEFSSPSCFAALLDRDRGGRFAMTPWRVRDARQEYLPDSNVLCTRFTCDGGALELLDFMSVPEALDAAGYAEAPQEIVRLARCTAGEVDLAVLFDARPDYARQRARLEPEAAGSWRLESGGFQALLRTTLPLQPGAQGVLQARARLRAGEAHAAVVQTGAALPVSADGLLAAVRQRLDSTLAWWRKWSEHCSYDGEHREVVMRSALALKLLTHRPTGAIVAAATTSLPESEQAERNWDYRYCWLRDTSLVLHALADLGYAEESRDFQKWLLHATRETRPRLQVMYGVHGESHLPERVLPHLRGYHGIGPVRIGNAASAQVQNDVYGEVILTTCEELQLGGELDDEERELLAGFAHHVCDVWREPDHGLWEIRLPPRHNTHSKLMCWAALDRALRLDRDHGLPIDARRVRREREAVRADIEANGWCEEVGSYVGYYGSRAPDASVLLMPRLAYCDANAPRMRGTVDYIMRELSAGGLLHRYPPGPEYDGVDGPEHLFAICGFWCVDCLARQGRLDEAEAMYQRLLDLRNPVGLFAEEYREDDGRPMGNYPQAFSHVGVITAGLSLTRARRHGKVDKYW